MGSDIFFCLRDHDFRLAWLCVSGEERDAQRRLFEKKAARLRSAGALAEGPFTRMMETTTITADPEDLAGADIVIEAITEEISAKRELFGRIGAIAGEGAVITTNTSSILPSLLAAEPVNPGRFAGLHFFYPVKMKNIAEIIVTDSTEESALARLKEFLRAIGKFHMVMHERDGFLLNRVFLDLQAQAWRYCEKGAAGPDCIDSIVKRDLYPAGVFGLFDAIGIDVVAASVKNYSEYAGDRSFYAPLIRELDRLVSLGRLGRKSGEGFFRYGPHGSCEDDECGEEARREISLTLRCLYINAACRALETGVCSREDLERALAECSDGDRGPFAMLDETGPGTVRRRLEEMHGAAGVEAFRPSALL